MLDTTYDIATPEGVELHLPLAGLAPRALAWLVDAIVKTVALGVASMFLPLLGNTGASIMAMLMFVMLWFYNVLFEVLGHGATPGKRYVGLAVMNRNGTPVGWSGSLLRNLIRFVDVLPGCYAFGCISVLISRRFQRLGDLAAGTIVVHRPKEKARSAIEAMAPQPVTVPLALDEQQAIVSFGERVGDLNPDRARELAELLGPVLGPIDTDRLRRYASWLSGKDQPA